MTTTSEITEDIEEVTRQVWESVFELEATPMPVDESLLTVTSSVQITGEWSGAVSVRMSAGLAERVATSMFETPADSLEEGDLEDAVGEMANMIGGNVKALLPGPSQLSLPTVVRGGAEPSFPGTATVERISFDVSGQPFTVTVRAGNERTDV